MQPQATVAANGLPQRGEMWPMVSLNGVARSRARVHSILPDVMYVPIPLQNVGSMMTINKPSEPPRVPVAWRYTSASGLVYVAARRSSKELIEYMIEIRYMKAVMNPTAICAAIALGRLLFGFGISSLWMLWSAHCLLRQIFLV